MGELRIYYVCQEYVAREKFPRREQERLLSSLHTSCKKLEPVCVYFRREHDTFCI